MVEIQSLNDVLLHKEMLIAQCQRRWGGIGKTKLRPSFHMGSIISVPDEIAAALLEIYYKCGTHFAPGHAPAAGVLRGTISLTGEHPTMVADIPHLISQAQAFHIMRAREKLFRDWHRKRVKNDHVLMQKLYESLVRAKNTLDESKTRTSEELACIEQATGMMAGWRLTSVGTIFLGTPTQQSVRALAILGQMDDTKDDSLSYIIRRARILQRISKYADLELILSYIHSLTRHDGFMLYSFKHRLLTFALPPYEGWYMRMPSDDARDALPTEDDLGITFWGAQIHPQEQYSLAHTRWIQYIFLPPRNPAMNLINMAMIERKSLITAWKEIHTKDPYPTADALAEAFKHWYWASNEVKKPILSEWIPTYMRTRVLGFQVDLSHVHDTEKAYINPIVASSSLSFENSGVLVRNSGIPIKEYGCGAIACKT